MRGNCAPDNKKKAGETLRISPASVCNRLQRAQKVQQILLLRAIEIVEVLNHLVSFAPLARVRLDRLDQVLRAPIVQEEYPLSQAPQRRSAELVARRAALLDVVRQTRAHVMDLDIGVRVYRGVA